MEEKEMKKEMRQREHSLPSTDKVMEGRRYQVGK